MDQDPFDDTDFVCFHNYLAIFPFQTGGTVLFLKLLSLLVAEIGGPVG
jgi:hypothetical protein